MLSLVLIIYIGIGMWSSGFVIGWKIRGRKSIDYKKRWQEANALLQDERLKTGELVEEVNPDQDRFTALVAIPANRFKLKAVKVHDYTYIKLWDGDSLVWESPGVRNNHGSFAYWIDNYTREGRKVMRSLSKVASCE